MSSDRLEVVANTGQYADTEVLSLKDLERLITQVATVLNKFGMRERAKGVANAAVECGLRGPA